MWLSLSSRIPKVAGVYDGGALGLPTREQDGYGMGPRQDSLPARESVGRCQHLCVCLGSFLGESKWLHLILDQS